MLGRENAGGKARFVVAGVDGNNGLGEDRAGIEFGAHKMHGTAGEPHAGRKRLPLGMKPAKGWQQGRVDVDHAVAPGIDKTGVEDAHKPGERDQFDIVPGQRGCGRGRKSGRVALRDHRLRNAGAGGVAKPRGLDPIADDERNLGRMGGIGAGRNQGREVRAATRNQHSHLEPRHAIRFPDVGRRRCTGLAMASGAKLLYDRCRGRAANISDRRRFAMTLPRAPGRAGTRRGRLAAGVLPLVLLVLLRAGPAPAQTVADPYSATVKLDATADNAVDARREARRDGERQALAKVVAQVSGAADVHLPKLSDDAVTDMVKSFEVAHERMSAVRYLADYTFHFSPDKVRRLMRQAHLAAAPATPPAAAAASGPPAAPKTGRSGGDAIVVLPVYEDGARAVLWNDPNPWRDAWSQYPNGTGPDRLVVPLGDIGDLAAIDAARADAGQPDALRAIARRNGGGEVVVALVKPRRNVGAIAGLDVAISEYRGGRLVGRSGTSLSAAPGEDQAALLGRAVTATASAIAHASAPAATAESSVAAVVPITDLGEWIAVRQRLAAVPMIHSIDLLSLNREEARVRLSYVGSPEQLKLALAAADLALDGGTPVWRLRPAGAAARP